MERETAGLNAQVTALQTAIAAAEAKAAALREKVVAAGKGDAGGSGVSLEELTSKVSEVYVRCGFEADSSISTLQMLANIEARLEEFLATVATMPAEFVEAQEKQQEKERRAKLREENLRAQKAEAERRQQRSLERFNAPIPKRTTKPAMVRHVLPTTKKGTGSGDKVKDRAAAALNEEEKELQEFMARGY